MLVSWNLALFMAMEMCLCEKLSQLYDWEIFSQLFLHSPPPLFRLTFATNTQACFSKCSLFAVVILCADPDAVRQLMLIAYELGFINGQYVFINIDLLSRSVPHPSISCFAFKCSSEIESPTESIPKFSGISTARMLKYFLGSFAFKNTAKNTVLKVIRTFVS